MGWWNNYIGLTLPEGLKMWEMSFCLFCKAAIFCFLESVWMQDFTEFDTSFCTTWSMKWFKAWKAEKTQCGSIGIHRDPLGLPIVILQSLLWPWLVWKQKVLLILLAQFKVSIFWNDFEGLLNTLWFKLRGLNLSWNGFLDSIVCDFTGFLADSMWFHRFSCWNLCWLSQSKRLVPFHKC